MIVIGADVHKHKHTFVAVDEVGRTLGEKTVPADSAGHFNALMWAREQFGADLKWGIEDCRNMSARLERDLLGADQQVVRVPTKLTAHGAESSRRHSDPSRRRAAWRERRWRGARHSPRPPVPVLWRRSDRRVAQPRHVAPTADAGAPRPSRRADAALSPVRELLRRWPTAAGRSRRWRARPRARHDRRRSCRFPSLQYEIARRQLATCAASTSRGQTIASPSSTTGLDWHSEPRSPCARDRQPSGRRYRTSSWTVIRASSSTDRAVPGHGTSWLAN